jgi:hypothetical protein
MTPETRPTPYDDELLREIAAYNARYAPTRTPPADATPDGSLPDDDPDWLDWQQRYSRTHEEEQNA